MAERVRAVRRRAARLVRSAGRTEARQPEVAGMVEQFSKRLVAGWVSVPKGTPPLAVSLHLGPLEIAATYATVSSTLSGSQSVPREGAARDRAGLVHSWQLPNIPGPAGDRRNSPQEIRTFAFRVREIWPYLKKRNRITVRVNGSPLPIYGHGMYLLPPKNGRLSLDDLRAKLDQGYLLTQFGRIQLSKELDVHWQERVIALYQRVRRFVADELGYDLFVIGGTLLGAVREGGYIGHDTDFDAAYVSRHTSGADAGQELVALGLALVNQGFAVECMAANLHVYDPADLAVRVDVFHVYFDEAGEFAMPWGIAGTSKVLRSDWAGTREIPFPGGAVLVPANAEQMVEHLYGEDWRLPKPGFNWNLDRTARAEEGLLSDEQRTVVHWADLHARSPKESPSSFFEMVAGLPGSPRTVVDLGCGDGYDACAFGASGRTVLALDRSEVGVRRGRERAAREGLDGRVSFEVCDVGDARRLTGLLEGHLAGAGGPTLFYAASLLDSVDAEAQESVLRVLGEIARPGDVLAVELRTADGTGGDDPSGVPCVRLQDGAALARRVHGSMGFDMLHDEVLDGPDGPVRRLLARRAGVDSTANDRGAPPGAESAETAADPRT